MGGRLSSFAQRLESGSCFILFLGSDASSFAISGSSGAITTNSVFDYETKTSYGGSLATLTLKVVDGSGSSATVSITVNVNNINDAPAFGSGSYTATITEEQPSSTALTMSPAVAATDEDSDTPVFSLVGKCLKKFQLKS